VGPGRQREREREQEEGEGEGEGEGKLKLASVWVHGTVADRAALFLLLHSTRRTASTAPLARSSGELRSALATYALPLIRSAALSMPNAVGLLLCSRVHLCHGAAVPPVPRDPDQVWCRPAQSSRVSAQDHECLAILEQEDR
jgi:hypothetical protein